MKIYTSVEQLVGKTPLLRLSGFEREYGLEAKIYAKLESFNPAGSIKDRVALSMLDDAEARGLLRSGGTVVEPTSGNTGLGLCAFGVARGYRVIIVMPSTMSEERIRLMRAYGAEVVLTDGKLGMAGAIEEAKRICDSTDGAFMPSQFDNPANPDAHYRTTAPEIWEDTDGELDFLVAGAGTGGTITGIGRYLKERCPDVKIIAVEPAASPVISGGAAGPHPLQGIGAGFIPENLDTDLIDEVIRVEGEEAYTAARVAASCDGVLGGITSGAALHAAATLARRQENRGKSFVVILPDGGEKYLSTELYQG